MGVLSLRRFPRAGDDGHVRRQRRQGERRRLVGITSQGCPFEGVDGAGRVLDDCWLDGERQTISVAVWFFFVSLLVFYLLSWADFMMAFT